MELYFIIYIILFIFFNLNRVKYHIVLHINLNYIIYSVQSNLYTEVVINKLKLLNQDNNIVKK